MPRTLGRPVRRVTIVLFEADAMLLERRYGRGWTEQIRRMVQENCTEYRRRKNELDAIMATTADDLED